jgi:predicted DsbA family dithiol-disulfide isomerase
MATPLPSHITEPAVKIDAMQIEIVSDTVCPWCFIGKRRLERAMALRSGVAFNLNWRPYRLDPTIPKEGVDRRTYLKAKFGDGQRTQSMGDVIRAEGSGEGISFAFEKIERSPNTLDSHRLIRWAASAGVQDEIVERLFRAYFLEGRDIGDRNVLLDIAREGGMDVEIVTGLLAGDADAGLIEREDRLAHEMGISGVPTFIFENRFMMSGAREPEVLVRVIDKAAELATTVR